MQNLPIIKKARLVIKPARTGWSKLRAQYTEPLLLLQLMVGAVLLICCANLSGLFLARALARRQEFAIRGALGAGRLRLMRQLFVECLMLALPGALLGVWLAWAVGPWILHMLGNREAEKAISMRPDLAVLSVSIACATMCALLFGMAPAWIASHSSIDNGLRSSNRRVSADAATLRNFFLPVQIALALALVVVAGLLGTTMNRLLTESSGYQTDHVYFALTDFLRIPQKGDAMVELYRRMAERIEHSPGVEQASVAGVTPLSGSRFSDFFVAADNAAHVGTVESGENIVSAHYFSTVGIPFLAGRDLVNNDSDRNSCVLSESAARLFFAGSSALGKTLREVDHHETTGTDTYSDCQVIGIVRDAKYDSLREPGQPIVYLPIRADSEETNAGATLYFMMRARSLDAARTAYLAALHQMAPKSPEIPPYEFNQTFHDSVARERLLSVLSGFFALLGLLLSGIGIYGLVAWQVTRRTTEIGLRMAFGASQARVFAFVMQQVLVLLAIGVFTGGIAAFFAARSVRTFLFEVQPGNPAVFAFSALALVFVALFAAALPARRAVSIDPMQALKSE
jgi:predicted permease